MLQPRKLSLIFWGQKVTPLGRQSKPRDLEEGRNEGSVAPRLFGLVEKNVQSNQFKICATSCHDKILLRTQTLSQTFRSVNTKRFVATTLGAICRQTLHTH